MRVYGMFFILVLDFRSVLSENDFSDCSVPAICKRSQYVESVWMPMSPAVCKANAGPKGDRGEVGEIGKSGPKGENGTKGEPGSIDSLVARSMETNVTQELQRRIECLETFAARQFPGRSDFYYGGKAYYLVLGCSKSVAYNQLNLYENATHRCAELHSRPADILNAKHQTMVEQAVRRGMANTATATMEIFLGMSYNVTTQTIHWSNGTALSAEDAGALRWWTTHRYPILEPTTLTSLGIGVTSSGLPEDNGLFNRHPENPTNGVLCIYNN